MLDSVAIYIGYTVMLISAVAFFIAIIDLEYSAGHHWVFKILGFGLVNISNYNTVLLSKMRELRKSDTAGFGTKNSTTFITAPTWFNRYIYNIGGVKA